MSGGMNVAFFGSSLVSAYWNGAATYYRGLLKALFELGYSVTFYEPDAYNRQKHRDIDEPLYARSVVYKAEYEGLKEALKMAQDADMVIKTSGVGCFDEALEEAVLSFKSSGKTVAFWDVDAPATLQRLQDNDEDPFIGLIPEYDMIFTYGGGERVKNSYLNFGAKKCFPIYNALDPSTHYPVLPEADLTGDLGFLGNRMPDREKRVKEFFFRSASLLPQKKFLLGGNGWDTYMSHLENVKRLGHVYTHEHNAFNCSTLAVLNINRQSMAEYGFSPPTRIFEAAGAGACIITDLWDGIDHFLQPGKECFTASDGEEVAAILDSLDVGISKEIGENARKKILSHHTYAHRAREVDGILKQYCSFENREVAK
ncbi:hypothetical protein CHISP_2865 [Chitinispirillum alkaliphilum]|nr:hypothetical protein CHISP_2865 [Chitinispirillum alkaliphilum]